MHLEAATSTRKLKAGHTGITWDNEVPQALEDCGKLGFHGFETFGQVMEAWDSNGGMERVLDPNHVPLVSAYYLVTDVLSGGGSWSAVLTLAIGLVYLAIGLNVDRGPRRPYGFWLHVTAGLLIGGALFYWWHSSEADYALLATAGVVFVGISARTQRSSWAVLGVAGFLVSTVHWVSDWTSVFSIFTPTRDWVPPLVYGVVGFFFVLLGLLVERRRQPG